MRIFCEEEEEWRVGCILFRLPLTSLLRRTEDPQSGSIDSEVHFRLRNQAMCGGRRLWATSVLLFSVIYLFLRDSNLYLFFMCVCEGQ